MCLLASDRPSVMGQSQSIQERPDGKKQTDGLNLPVFQRARSKILVLRGGIGSCTRVKKHSYLLCEVTVQVFASVEILILISLVEGFPRPSGGKMVHKSLIQKVSST